MNHTEFKSINNDSISTYMAVTGTNKIPKQKSLAAAGNEPGYIGNVIFNQADGYFYGHNGAQWDLLSSNSSQFKSVGTSFFIIPVPDINNITVNGSGTAGEISFQLDNGDFLPPNTLLVKIVFPGKRHLVITPSNQNLGGSELYSKNIDPIFEICAARAISNTSGSTQTYTFDYIFITTN